MTELVNSGNALSKALLQILAPALPGAHVGEGGILTLGWGCLC